jgi:hypothetical protein
MLDRWVKPRKTTLVSFQSAIRVELVLEDPFVDDYVGANGSGDEISGVVDDQGIKFCFYCVPPIRIGEHAWD